jgi:hypothetical protein
MVESIAKMKQEAHGVKDGGNLYVLKMPIKYVLAKLDNDHPLGIEDYNPFGWDEMILLAHDKDIVHYMGVAYENGVLKEVDYLQALPEEWFDATLGIQYQCKGFINLKAESSQYLFDL